MLVRFQPASLKPQILRYAQDDRFVRLKTQVLRLAALAQDDKFFYDSSYFS
jgi:hypothetical protein